MCACALCVSVAAFITALLTSTAHLIHYAPHSRLTNSIFTFQHYHFSIASYHFWAMFPSCSTLHAQYSTFSVRVYFCPATFPIKSSWRLFWARSCAQEFSLKKRSVCFLFILSLGARKYVSMTFRVSFYSMCVVGTWWGRQAANWNRNSSRHSLNKRTVSASIVSSSFFLRRFLHTSRLSTGHVARAPHSRRDWPPD